MGLRITWAYRIDRAQAVGTGIEGRLTNFSNMDDVGG